MSCSPFFLSYASLRLHCYTSCLFRLGNAAEEVETDLPSLPPSLPSFQGYCIIATSLPFSLFDHAAGARSLAVAYARGEDYVEGVYGPRIRQQVRKGGREGGKEGCSSDFWLCGLRAGRRLC